ncbi:MAG: hypothetical protein HZC02_00225 [Candidatus Levybacteria bacterium]|nr:hypothetical protein [Candidatus Levybacteria bacterium]
MKKILLILTLLLFTSTPALALEDPLSVPNNKIGIHILFTTELDDAAQLVNGNNGDWGYVLIPIQSGDKDLKKWQEFMDKAKEKHLIPIIRLATEGDYFNTHVWRKPDETDILDFANFLNSLEWPTKNRYVIVFNEVNRGDEWGGEANPAEYAQLLSYAVTVFKSINQDFFMISSGMDNAAPNQGSTYINQYSFFDRMNGEVPGIFNQVDGLASHSYPNPGFSQPPSVVSSSSIVSFYFERKFIQKMSSKSHPIFITETGWSNEKISDKDRASYYMDALSNAWSDKGIVAITPFILRASGPFAKFSFMTEDGNPTEQYQAIKNMIKIKGQPILSPEVLSVVTQANTTTLVKSFSSEDKPKSKISLSKALQSTFKWLMKI